MYVKQALVVLLRTAGFKRRSGWKPLRSSQTIYICMCRFILISGLLILFRRFCADGDKLLRTPTYLPCKIYKIYGMYDDTRTALYWMDVG